MTVDYKPITHTSYHTSALKSLTRLRESPGKGTLFDACKDYQRSGHHIPPEFQAIV